MRINDIPFAVLRLQYRIARFPLQLIDDRVISRLDSEAPARLFYQHSLGTLDARIGHALGDSEVRRQGVAARERSDKLARAARLVATADQKLDQADGDLKSARQDAVAQVKNAQDVAQNDIAEARETAAQRKRSAEQRAQKGTANAVREADELAAHRKNSAKVARRQEEVKILAEEQKATAAAKGSSTTPR